MSNLPNGRLYAQASGASAGPATVNNLHLGQGGPFDYLRHLRVPDVTSFQIPPNHPQASLIEAEPANDFLDTPYHPIFFGKNWLNVDENVFPHLISALQLATQLLTEPSLMSWWLHARFGVFQTGPNGYFLATSGKQDQMYIDNVNSVFQELAGNVTFGFMHLRAEPNQTVEPDAIAFPNDFEYHEYCKGKAYRKRVGGKLHRPHIMLHIHYLYDIHFLRTRQEKSQADWEHLWLRMAITLVHEIAHIFFEHRWGSNIPEPYHNLNDKAPEMGYSWENYVFGGHVWAIDHPERFVAFYSTRYQHMAGQPQIKVIIPCWWIHLFFRKSIWRNFKTLWERGVIRLPSSRETRFWIITKPSGMFLVDLKFQTTVSCYVYSKFILWDLYRPQTEGRAPTIQEQGQDQRDTHDTSYCAVSPRREAEGLQERRE